MLRFYAKRLVVLLLAVLVAHSVGFAYAFPGNPLLDTRYDEPLLPGYAHYLQEVVHTRDLGGFPDNEERVMERLAPAVLASTGLLLLVVAGSVLLGPLIGILAVREDPPRIARWMVALSTFGLAMPSFYLGSVLIVGFIYYTIRGGPEAGLPLPLQGYGWDAHLVLPMLALLFRPTVQIAQVTSETLAAELGKPYVVAARSLGYTARRIRWRLALRNALTPILITISNSFRTLIGELILIEFLFRWPGAGRLLVLVVIYPLSYFQLGPANYLFQYPPLVAALFAVFAAWFLLGDTLATVLIRRFDPRGQP